MGIGFIVIFSTIFNQPSAAVAPTEYERNLKELASVYKATCFDPKCAAEIVTNCDESRHAIVESGNNRVWIVGAVKTSSYCHGYFIDFNVLAMKSRFGDFTTYNCHIPNQELQRLKGSSFEMLLSNVNEHSGWRCGISVP